MQQALERPPGRPPTTKGQNMTAFYTTETHKFYNQLPETDERGCSVCESNDTLLQEILVGGKVVHKIHCADCVFEAHGIAMKIVVLNNPETTTALADAAQNWLSDVAESRAERAADGL
jgi:hypothetical protein